MSDPRLLPPPWDAARAAPRWRVRLLVALALPLAAWYFGWLLQPERVGEPALYGLLIAAELFNLFQATGFWWTITRARGTEPARGATGSEPEAEVDVLIPVYDEPVEIVEPTVRAATALRGARAKVYVLDDGRREEVRAMARRRGAGYIRRFNRDGAKAGNINSALARTSSPFVAVFDCDHVPSPRFLERTLAQMREPDLALVQTPQYYGNSRSNQVAAASWAQQALFFGAIARGKDGDGAMFCCGTNFLFRRAALESVGGFPTDSVTEDFELSIKLHERGWRARYLPEVLAVGLGPEDMASYVSQQQRWARGCVGAIGSVLRARLPVRIRLQYLLSSLYFLSGWTLLAYMAFPVIRILTGAQPVAAASADQFLIHFAPYFAIALSTVAVAGAGAYSFAGLALAASGFWIHIQASFLALLRSRPRFVVTPKRGAAQRQPRSVAPALVAIAVLSGAAAYGAFQDYSPATLNNIAFAALHVCVLAAGVRLALVTHAAAAPSASRAPEPRPGPRGRRVLRPAYTVLGVVGVVVVASLGLRLDGVSPFGSGASAAEAKLEAEAAADDFLDRYMAADGRVIRHDQGGDTVSEGQAYAMLLAVATGDEERFQRAWEWARANLQRPDGLLATHWADGRVVDDDPAADADLDAARALLLAASVFGEPGYGREALRLSRGLLANETVKTGVGPVLVAGPWARGRPATVNPSYFDPQAFAALEAASGDERWSAIGRGSERILDQLMRAAPALPPDWAALDDAAASPAPTPGSDSAPTYGFDAARVGIRMAGACDPGGRGLAARPWRFLERQATGAISSRYTLDGRAVGGGTHPVAMVGAAGTADAAGDLEARDELLDRAADADAAAPTYYGAAWVALGRVMLTTGWLQGCPADAGRRYE